MSSFLTPLTLWVRIFIHEWLNIQFNFDSERQIFEKLFLDRFIYSQIFLFFFFFFVLPETDRNLLKWIRRKNVFFFFIFRFYDWPGIRTRAPQLISQHSTFKTIAVSEYGDYIIFINDNSVIRTFNELSLIQAVVWW